MGVCLWEGMCVENNQKKATCNCVVYTVLCVMGFPITSLIYDDSLEKYLMKFECRVNVPIL